MTSFYESVVNNTAREVRVHNLLGTGSAQRNEELGQRVIAAATRDGVSHRTACREWVAAINTPHADDKELAELHAKWEAIQPAEGTTGWYHKWFCENTMDMGISWTIGYYQACLAQYAEWEAEDVDLDTLKEYYDEIMAGEYWDCNENPVTL